MSFGGSSFGALTYGGSSILSAQGATGPSQSGSTVVQATTTADPPVSHGEFGYHPVATTIGVPPPAPDPFFAPPLAYGDPIAAFVMPSVVIFCAVCAYISRKYVTLMAWRLPLPRGP